MTYVSWAACYEGDKDAAYFDVLIPRGGAGLIKAVVENATVPVIETGIGSERRPTRETVADTVTAQPVFQRQPRTFGQVADRAPERAAE